MDAFNLFANLVDIEARRIMPAEVEVRNGRIHAVREVGGPVEGYLIPGFIDAHVHVESSMLVPSEFARLAVVHGTVATISDPHEIANVLGEEGVEYMIENGAQVPFHFFFGAPSCVPATRFETAGAELDAAAVGRLLDRPEVLYLSEVMDFPGVINGDPEVMRKIAHAHRTGKVVDGHAPGLRGEGAARYIRGGDEHGGVVISTDHECFTLEEALDKVQHGMHISIREGSAARNLDALMPLLLSHPEKVMLCCDDTHPDSLVLGHINSLCKRAVTAGVDVFDVLRAACLNPIAHYKLPVGHLHVGDPADMVLLENLMDFKVLRTWVRGQLVAEKGRSLIRSVPAGTPNKFNCAEIAEAQLRVPAKDDQILAIEALDGQLITHKKYLHGTVRNGELVADVDRDLLKIAVVNRYATAPVALGWIRNIGLKRGAIASCVAHDSHNIVAVGANDADLCEAINAVIAQRGGISVCDAGVVQALPLPVAGIMSTADAYEVAAAYAALDGAAKALGSTLRAPFMTLSFMALLVIPHVKLSDKGLFDGDAFELITSGT
ncbi:MAG: adenine deaminase [Flavobacteriales bacterium]|nr:adenine deaminase [Flavobacteriales bacterium]